MLRVILWLILFVLCWPLAILALVLYPIVWLVLLPFRLVRIAVEGVFALIKAIVLLSARVLGAGKYLPRLRQQGMNPTLPESPIRVLQDPGRLPQRR